MSYGEKIEGVYAEYRRFGFQSAVVDVRKSATVEHVGKNRVKLHLSKADSVTKTLTVKHINLIGPDGRDLVKEWTE
ncbi:MAG: hypothetical protein KJ947_10380 [Alphaproteobacteria bacterium]|nr:hypothetical protein [Alphaproteobacteria bacterium]MBU1549965.1 hypothetical protein [Alphaproteobacteria bacterium]MBU2336579.1 hypothetical protein [Alphaproteobacteria bacterium]MBU2387312.1 hypothetical protein [Alphaproteobacteria bacterium]